jgi:hypothetical protein
MFGRGTEDQQTMLGLGFRPIKRLGTTGAGDFHSNSCEATVYALTERQKITTETLYSSYRKTHGQCRRQVVTGSTPFQLTAH